MNKKIVYTDEPLSFGKPVDDFLPPPHALVPVEDTVKVTLNLSRDSIEFFKKSSKENGVPYQKMIRALIDSYTQHHTEA